MHEKELGQGRPVELAFLLGILDAESFRNFRDWIN